MGQPITCRIHQKCDTARSKDQDQRTEPRAHDTAASTFQIRQVASAFDHIGESREICIRHGDCGAKRGSTETLYMLFVCDAAQAKLFQMTRCTARYSVPTAVKGTLSDTFCYHRYPK